MRPIETSTSKRRNRIFDSKRSNNSVSPNNQILSPLKAQETDRSKDLNHSIDRPTKQSQKENDLFEKRYPTYNTKS